jgi:hypothetical protein
MAAAPLVESQIADGERIIAQLDRDRFKVAAALWLYDVENDDWRLIIASDIVTKKGPRNAYKKLRQSVDAIPEGVQTFPTTISLVESSHSLIKLLRQAIKTGPGIKRIRFTKNVINGQLIEDALIYRLI